MTTSANASDPERRPILQIDSLHSNRGWSKSAWNLRNSPDEILLVLRETYRTRSGPKTRTQSEADDDLDMELASLDHLASIGVPVLQIRWRGYTSNGSPAIIVPRYAGSAKLNHLRDFWQHYNEDSFIDVEQTMRILRERQIFVHDLQFLISKSGKVVINDPAALSYGKPHSRLFIQVEAEKRLGVRRVQVLRQHVQQLPLPPKQEKPPSFQRKREKQSRRPRRAR